MKRGILIIGEESFLAKNLKRHFVKRGLEALCVRSDFITRDNKAHKLISSLLKDKDLIITPGVESISDAWSKPHETLKSQFLESLNILCILRDLNFKNRVIFIGSGEEYGRTENVSSKIKEGDPLDPLNIFGASKACQSLFAQLYHKSYGLDIIVARCFNEIGVGQADKFFVSNICKQLAFSEKRGLKETKISVGNLLVKRCFIDVRDISKAIELLLEKGRSGEIYNIGSDTPIQLSDLLDLISKKTNRKINCEAEIIKFRLLDPPVLIPSTEKLKEHTGWKQDYPLEVTIEEIYNYWLKYFENEKKIIVD